MAYLLKSPQLSPKNLFWFPYFLIIYSFTGNISNDIYMPSMPALVHEFATSQYWIQLTLTFWFLGTALPQLLLGPVADRYGRRPLLLVGGFIFLLATFICGSTHHISSLVIARFFQGVGVCSLTIISFAVISELFKEKKCIQLLALVSICNAIAPLLGPLIGGYLFLKFGWRINFYLVFIMALIGLIGLWHFMPESKFELDKTAIQVKTFICNYRQLLKNKFFMRHLLAYGLFFSGIIAYLTGAPFILIAKLNLAPQYFGFTQLSVFSAYFLSAISVGRLVDRYGCHKMITTGAVITVLGSIIMLIVGYLFPMNLYTFVGAMMLYAFGFGFAGSPLARETLSVIQAPGGSTAAMLGFSMTSFGSLSSLAISLTYNGTMIVIASILCVMAILGLLFYFIDYLKMPQKI